MVLQTMVDGGQGDELIGHHNRGNASSRMPNKASYYLSDYISLKAQKESGPFNPRVFSQ